MTTQTHQPWKPTCWVGGQSLGISIKGLIWVGYGVEQLSSMPDDSREKYAATKATAAILRSMRK